MNLRLILYIIGQIMRVEGLLMLLPFACSLIYREDSWHALLIPILLLLIAGTLLTLRRPAERDRMGVRDGLFVVGVSWVVLSLFGMLPFIISGAIPHPVDAFFETVSGFTTTGATVLGDAVGTLPGDLDHGIALWRSLTHWIGGMGVLVFVLAVMPQQQFKSARLMHAMRAEVPGPTATKVVATIRRSAIIMYAIYVALTLIEIVCLLFGGMSLFDAVLHTFSTAGTGGFSNMNTSIGAFDSSYIHWVITAFMLIFSINFNLYYLILIGHVSQALKSEELRWFLIVVASSVTIVTLNILPGYDSFAIALRDAAFTVSSFISTTGFTTATYDAWPQLSQAILVLLMFIGGCAGSTCGGLKISRLIILIKSAFRELRFILRPREVRAVRVEGKPADDDTIRGVNAYFSLFMLIFTLSTVLLMILNRSDLLTSFTAVASCLNNVGPGLGELGILGGGSFGGFTVASKLLLSFNMLLGRLELFPILILFLPSAWSKK
ncbi:MAG: TrkH family potassium uptake protein [Ruminococcaceae bacterium]|nr:TrkH family potassium uptake protein [Oscillospiraceae bacterium]